MVEIMLRKKTFLFCFVKYSKSHLLMAKQTTSLGVDISTTRGI